MDTIQTQTSGRTWRYVVFGVLIGIGVGIGYFASQSEGSMFQASTINSSASNKCCILDQGALSCRVVNLDEIGSCTADYQVTKTADKTTVQSGDEITYTVTYQNTSGQTLTNVQIRDNYDQSQIEIITKPGVCNDDGDFLTCTIGQMLSQQNGSLTYTARVKGSSFQH